MRNVNSVVQNIFLLSSWGRALALTFFSIVMLLAIYRETFFSTVSIWMRSETFAHCFLIFPISGYLIWQRRKVLAGLTPRANILPLAIIGILGFGWLLGNMTEAAVVQQFTLVAMIPMLVWAVLGKSVAGEIAFPLAFLLFSVPFGEFLLPSMIEFTADFTVGMLKITGMPVFREGTYFSIPTGDWSVVEACSGLRYLIASITLGCLFAYMNYRSTLRRVLFISLALIVPVIANGFRAYMIVMIGHLSNMTLAMGVDHFIYGWLFFGIVMTLLFWFGSRWKEEDLEIEPACVASLSTSGSLREWRMLATSVCALMIASIWPMRASYINSLASVQMAAPVALMQPETVSPWRRTDMTTSWSPKYQGAQAERQDYFTDGNHVIALFIKYYRGEEQGRELVNSQNVLVHEKDPIWKMPEESSLRVSLGGREIKILQGRLQSREQELLTWRWNWISGEYTSNEFMAKILQASNKMMGGMADEAGIILAVDVKDDMQAAQTALQNFVDVMLPSIKQSLEKASAGNSR